MTRSYKPSNDILDDFNRRLVALERLSKRVDNRFTVRTPQLDFNHPPLDATENELRVDAITDPANPGLYWYKDGVWHTVVVAGGGAITWEDVGT